MNATRWMSTSRANNMKVSVLGAAGGIGQPMSLLLKQSSLISHLSLFDIVNTPGVAADLSHINTSTKVYHDIFVISIICLLRLCIRLTVTSQFLPRTCR